VWSAFFHVGAKYESPGECLQDKESDNMQATYTYQIEVQGQVDEMDFNRTSPLQVTVKRADSVATLFTLRADQSGFVGLIRHLHHQGFVLLSMSRT
jgi:hypothetical protein